MRDPSGYYGRHLYQDVIVAHRIRDERPREDKPYILTDKEARCLECPLPEFNVRACSKCPFDMPEEDPCLSCKSRAVCESHHGTCSEKARWSGAQGRR